MKHREGERGTGLGILDGAVHRTCGLDLRGGQARRRIITFALEHPGIERAAIGLIDDAVLHAIERIARLQRRVMNRRIFFRWNVAVAAAVDHAIELKAHAMKPR